MDKNFKKQGAKPVVLYTFVSVSILLLMTLFATFYFMSFKKSVSESNYKYLMEISSQSAESINSKMDRNIRILESLSALLSQNNDINHTQLMHILQYETNENSFIRMGIATADGNVDTTDGARFNIADRGYFKSAMRGQSAMSPTIIDKFDKKTKINVLSVPVFKNKNVTGVLFGTIDSNVYKNILNFPTFGGNGNSYLVDSNGEVITQLNDIEGLPVLKNVLKNIQFKDNNKDYILKSDFANRNQNILTCYIGGQAVYLIYSPLAYNGWFYVATTPKMAVIKSLYQFALLSFVTAICIILLFAGLFFYILFIMKKHSKTLEDMAYVDDLTGGHTWNYFKKTVDSFLNNKEKSAFLLFDIKKFNVINDIFGYQAGNRTLKYISDKIEMMTKNNGVSARIGSDKFCAVWNYSDKEQLTCLIETLFSYFEDYRITPTTPYSLSCSCGIYEIDEKEPDFEQIYIRANLAKLLVDSKPDSNYNFYTDEMRAQLLYQTELERDMDTALQKKDFVVYLQPKFRLNDVKPVGAEALVRWNHPKHGLIPPIDFIPLFEKNGFISRLDLYIFDTVCQRIRAWIDEGLPQITVSVNISRVNFHNEDLAEILYSIAKEHNVPTSCLEIEITESAIFDNLDTLIYITKELRNLGFLISIDDFGTGYSSLNLLKNLEVDVLKLDREFFNFGDVPERSKKVVKNIISMAKDMSIATISEGVETEEHIQFLQEIGCDMAQGYYFARPMPLHEFEEKIFSQLEVNSQS
ncbi:MAG: EAL domain-containing protein [Candidatus Gastranaerophilales bacterium]|nr:EAL domain-containing protein [Candidatus Gastranaerophilales bacterium]